MLRGLALLAAGWAFAPAVVAQKKPVTIEAITKHPYKPAGEPVWAADGSRFAYLQDKTVWLYEVVSKSKKEVVSLASLESAATRCASPEGGEWQDRNVKEPTLQWFPSGKDLLVRAGGDLFVFRVGAGGWVQLTATPECERDPRLSPDGRKVSFRRGHELYVLDVESRVAVQLTKDSSETVWNAQLDWVYPEELGLETAQWWAPDSRHIAYLQFDVGREPLYPHADLLGLSAKYEPQRYPKAGEPNADVRLGVVAVEGLVGTRWMDVRGTADLLLARVKWLPDSRSVAVERLNRIQNRLELLVADAETGAARVLFRESDPYWIDVTDDLRFLRGGQEFLWSSERDGFRHLYRYSIDGRVLGQLTRGPWEVTGVAGVNETAGDLYYLSTEAGPLERHLYRMKLGGGPAARLTTAPGTHAISMSPNAVWYLDTWSSLTQPPRKALYRDGGPEWAVFEEPDHAFEEYDIRPAEIVQVKTSDGAVLYARLVRPAGFAPGRKYPVIVLVYGGPHAQHVRNTWSGLSFEQVLAQRGFVVWQLDNRGTAGRGHAWETAVFRRFGARELEDQKQGVAHLVSLGFVDEARLGIYGWSFGGYMTLYSLLNAPDLFAAGVAGAPVTDWRNYDTIYTERYLGLPSENADGYQRSSPVNSASALKAKLLLVHNFEDDNVLFQNTLQMAAALEKAGKPFHMVVYPQKTHHVGEPLDQHLYETVVAFFEEALKAPPEAPAPANAATSSRPQSNKLSRPAP